MTAYDFLTAGLAAVALSATVFLVDYSRTVDLRNLAAQNIVAISVLTAIPCAVLAVERILGIDVGGDWTFGACAWLLAGGFVHRWSVMRKALRCAQDHPRRRKDD